MCYIRKCHIIQLQDAYGTLYIQSNTNYDKVSVFEVIAKTLYIISQKSILGKMRHMCISLHETKLDVRCKEIR